MFLFLKRNFRRLSAFQPLLIHVKDRRQTVKNIRPRNIFTVDILADMTFPNLHSLSGSSVDQIDLLLPPLLHGLFQSVCKCILCHRLSSCISPNSSIVFFSLFSHSRPGQFKKVSSDFKFKFNSSISLEVDYNTKKTEVQYIFYNNAARIRSSV